MILVHGAFADSTSWNGVIARLQQDGYRVVAVANPLRALHSDAEFLRSVLDSVDGPVVVAGHSYGGSVMSEAVDGETAADLYIEQEKFPEVFAADVPPHVASLMAVTQRPILGGALEEKATRAAWKSIPSWTMVTRQDLAIPAASQRFMAERAGSSTVEIDASHAVTVSQPNAVADLIAELVIAPR